MSEADIEAGARWGEEITKQLEVTQFGIICVTKESLNAPWLIFEAGAMATAMGNKHVCPYLVDLEAADILGPLVQFQAVKAEKEGTWRLVETIYRSLERRQTAEDRFRGVFEKFWPDLERVLEELPPPAIKSAGGRSDRSILEEVLETVRGIVRPSSKGGRRESTVRIDISMATGRAESFFDYRYDPDEFGFQQMLNTLFSRALQDVVPPSTYGRRWQLVVLGSDKAIEKHGDNDRRSIREAGIESGMTLKVVLLAERRPEQS
jgi:hypothetical protein